MTFSCAHVEAMAVSNVDFVHDSTLEHAFVLEILTKATQYGVVQYEAAQPGQELSKNRCLPTSTVLEWLHASITGHMAYHLSFCTAGNHRSGQACSHGANNEHV